MTTEIATLLPLVDVKTNIQQDAINYASDNISRKLGVEDPKYRIGPVEKSVLRYAPTGVFEAPAVAALVTANVASDIKQKTHTGGLNTTMDMGFKIILLISLCILIFILVVIIFKSNTEQQIMLSNYTK